MHSHDNRLDRDLKKKKKKIHPYPVSVSAAGPRLFLWCLPVYNLKGAVLRWRVDYGGFPLSLQLGGHSNDNVLHLVLLVQHLSVGPHVWARVRRVFGGGLKEHHVASLGETHGPLLAHLAVRAAGVAEVTLIPHQEPEAETEIMITNGNNAPRFTINGNHSLPLTVTESFLKTFWIILCIHLVKCG